MKIFKNITSAFLVLVFAGNLSSQEVWGLEKCILHAQQASIVVNQTQLAVDQAKINLNQAKQSRNPNLNANTGVNWNFGRTIDPTTNDFITSTFFSNNLGLNTGVSLFEGFRIKNSIEQSEVDLEASKQDMDQARRDIGLTVSTNYLNVLFADENIKISERQLQLSQQQLDQINKSISAGATPESERLNLEAQIAQSEQMLIDSRNNFDIAMLQLKQTLRLDPSFPLEIEAPEGIVVDTNPDLIEFEYAFEQALQNRPDLSSAQMRIKSAQLGTKVAKGLHFPSLRVGGSLGTAYSNQRKDVLATETIRVEDEVYVTYDNPVFPLNDALFVFGQDVDVPTDFSTTPFRTQYDQNLSYGFGVGINIPIYNNGGTKAGVQRAKLNEINAQLNYDQAVENLKIFVQQALAAARASKKKLEASEKAVEAQQLAFDNTSKRLDLGAANTFEWENQKTQLENAELTRLIDKYNYLFNIKVLEFYLGKPLKL